MYAVFPTLLEAEQFCRSADEHKGYPRAADQILPGGKTAAEAFGVTLHYSLIIDTTEGYAVLVDAELLSLLPNGILLLHSLPDPFTGAQ